MTKLGKTLILLGVIVLGITIYFYSSHKAATTDQTQTIPTPNKPSVAITKVDIKETNFTGSKPAITGSGIIVSSANDYVNKRIAEFKVMADTDVPDIRAKFGPDSASSNYTLDIDAQYLKGDKTESIVLSEYAFTGGAHGNSTYIVFTSLIGGDKLLGLADVIKKEKQAEFITLLKKKLTDWRPEGSEAEVVFPDEVSKLEFSSLKDWSMDQNNLTIYFDQYEIGPGVLGETAFPIPKAELQSDLAI